MSELECEFYSLSCDPEGFWTYVAICLVLVSMAGMMAGLTMGLLSLDKLNMRILEMEGSEEQKQRAAKILPIITQHHFLLVTLLLVNAGANEALPIFLNKLVPEAVSIVLSVTCVLLFGEIIPSALFTGPNQLQIAASLAPFVKVLMIVTSPLAYPISRVLDFFLGKDHEIARYKRKELKALIALQRENDAAKREFLRRQTEPIDEEEEFCAPSRSISFATSESSDQSSETPRESFLNSEQSTRLHVDEVTIIHGALDLSSKNLADVMIPIDEVYMLEYDTKLNGNVLADILAAGHSRIPVYKENVSNIVGMLLVKRLIVLDPGDERPVRDLCLRKPIITSPNQSCYAMLNEFQKGRSHIALLTEQSEEVMECWEQGRDIPPDVEFVGIVTIEDVIEELIQEEIQDESDVYVQDVVNYWKKRSRSKRLRGLGKGFVKKRLKALAERARSRVRNRKKAHAASASAQQQSEPPIQVTIVNETTPLVHQFGTST